jgi:hypothetical protein
MKPVMATAMDGAEVFRMIRPALTLFDQMMGSVGTGQTAKMADTLVTNDDRRRQLAPCLSAIVTINSITSNSLLRTPTERAMFRRFPRHALSVPFLSLRNMPVNTAFLDSG